MSSKSRKNSPAPGTRARRPAEDAFAAPEKDEHDELDELLHAPKETSKLKFALMIALVIFLLIIFIVPSAFMGLGQSAKRDDPAAFSWERPGVGEETVYASEVGSFHFALDEARQLDPFLPFTMAFEEQGRVSIRDAARILVLARLAEDAGIRVPTEDLGTYLNERIIKTFLQGDADQYRAIKRGMRTEFEETVRTCLAVQRFLQMVGYAGSIAHPAAVEEKWADQHEAVELQYLKVAASEFEDAARSELPDDAGLEAWLLEKPENEQRVYFTDERRTVEAYVYRDPDTTPAAGLLTAYPGPEDVVAEDQAREYYDRVHFRRFLKPSEAVTTDVPFPVRDSIPFEEVQETCLVEAPIYDAMQAWLSDARSRMGAGEEVDLAAEATAHGLEVVRVEDVTRAGLEDHPVLGKADMINALFATSADDLSFLPAWTEGIAGFGKTLSRVQPSLPAFAEIRDEVAEDWVTPRAEELATEHMDGLWEQFSTFEPEDAFPGAQTVRRSATAEEFLALATESGLEVFTRDFVDRGGSPDDDPNYDNPDNTFLWGRRDFAVMELDEVAEPAVGNGDTLYLVRLSGRQPVSIDRMKPSEYQNFRRAARSDVANSMVRELNLDYLQTHYGMVELAEGILSEAEELEEEAAAEEAEGSES